MRFTPEEGFDLPITAVVCPNCVESVTIDRGFDPLDALWLHEYECSAVYLDYELSPGYELPARPDDEQVVVPFPLPLAA